MACTASLPLAERDPPDGGTKNMRFYDASWGTDQTYPHFAVPWALAFDTPYQWTKEVASHFGGTRNGYDHGLARARKIDSRNPPPVSSLTSTSFQPSLKRQGLPEAGDKVNGIAQRPIEGVSMAYTWDKTNANAPHPADDAVLSKCSALARSTTTAGLPRRLPSSHHGPLRWPPLPTDVMNSFKWQLYDLGRDWTQATRIWPTRCRTSCATCSSCSCWKPRSTRSFRSTTVPLLGSSARNQTTRRAEPFRLYRRVQQRAVSGQCRRPELLNKSYTITAEIEIPEGGAEGMLVTDGGRFRGYGFYLLKGKPVFTWNLIQLDIVKWQGEEALTPGKHSVEFDWKYDGPGLGKGGTGTLKVDGKTADSHAMAHSLGGPSRGRNLQRRH